MEKLNLINLYHFRRRKKLTVYMKDHLDSCKGATLATLALSWCPSGHGPRPAGRWLIFTRQQTT